MVDQVYANAVKRVLVESIGNPNANKQKYVMNSERLKEAYRHTQPHTPKDYNLLKKKDDPYWQRVSGVFGRKYSWAELLEELGLESYEGTVDIMIRESKA